MVWAALGQLSQGYPPPGLGAPLACSPPRQNEKQKSPWLRGGQQQPNVGHRQPPGEGASCWAQGLRALLRLPCSRGCAVQDTGWVLPTSCPRDGSSSSTPRSWGSVSTWVRVPETCVCWEHFPAVGAKHAHLRGVGFLPPGLRFGCPALLAARPAQAVRGHGGASPATALVLLTPNLTASPALKQKVLL